MSIHNGLGRSARSVKKRCQSHEVQPEPLNCLVRQMGVQKHQPLGKLAKVAKPLLQLAMIALHVASMRPYWTFYRTWRCGDGFEKTSY